jgi:hypothetical protein
MSFPFKNFASSGTMLAMPSRHSSAILRLVQLIALRQSHIDRGTYAPRKVGRHRLRCSSLSSVIEPELQARVASRFEIDVMKFCMTGTHAGALLSACTRRSRPTNDMIYGKAAKGDRNVPQIGTRKGVQLTGPGEHKFAVNCRRAARAQSNCNGCWGRTERKKPEGGFARSKFFSMPDYPRQWAGSELLDSRELLLVGNSRPPARFWHWSGRLLCWT